MTSPYIDWVLRSLHAVYEPNMCVWKGKILSHNSQLRPNEGSSSLTCPRRDFFRYMSCVFYVRCALNLQYSNNTINVPSLADKMALTVKLTIQPNGRELEHALLQVCRPNLFQKHQLAVFHNMYFQWSYIYIYFVV